MSAVIRKKFVFKGRVQGVGFRPTVYNLAKKFGLAGTVLNSPDGVIVEVEGSEALIDKFLQYLKQKQPPQARISKIESSVLPAIGYMSFRILPSAQAGEKTVLVSPDIATCKECEKELFNPKDRRFGYPFINCTNCGPRFTIMRDIPYDRAKTTMQPFHMCSLCEFEYSDPENRRFHAEPNACEDCGPHIFLYDNYGRRIETLDPILKTVQLLKEGKIVAIKSLGGYNLACDASNPEAIAELRRRKARPDKPFAVMSYSLREVKSYAKVSDKESELLQSAARPIVLLKKRKGALIPESIAPGNSSIGVMLPYNPVQFLILKDNFVNLIMTSGNISGEPIVKDDEKAPLKLRKLADYLLIYDRKIWNRCDDSIVRVLKNKPTMLRRSRGYSPDPIRISNEPFPEILALGAELKNTFTMTRGRAAYPSQYIGDLNNSETLEFLKEAISRYQGLFRVQPKAVAHDLHPDYLSTRLAASIKGLKMIPVQHHQAHISSVMAEHNINCDVIGVAYDGTGYGSDGAVWGGEFFSGRPGIFERKAHLKYAAMPGGDAAVKEPYRMAFSYLYDAYGDEAEKLKIDFVKTHRSQFKLLKKMLKSGTNSPMTSSMGRFFDAVAALIGLRQVISYEGQAAIELESIAQGKGYKSYEFELDESLMLDPAPIIKGIVEDLKALVPAESISYKFHNTIAKATGRICKAISKETKIKKVCLSGGVFQNNLLLESTIRELKKLRLETYINEKVPTNDGGISLGQARFAKDVLGNTGQS